MTTEKELADKLFEAHGGPVLSDYEWRKLARTAAEALGAPLAPEKTKPGAWHKTADGRPAFVDDVGDLVVVDPDGEVDYPTSWPALIPARVISEEEYTSLLAEVASLQESLDEARDLQQALQRDKDEWEANYQRLVSIRADEDANPGDAQYALAKTVVLTEDEVGELWDALASSRAEWGAYTGPFHEHVTAVVNAARAKHGGARELPGREQLLAAICGGLARTGGWSSARGADVADKIEALLKGVGDE